MEENMNISNSEMKVMQKIWDIGNMVTVPEIVAILNEEGEEWAYQTVATFLKRLEAKEVLSSTKKGNKLCYFPTISKEQYKKREARGFVNSKFSGSLKSFLVAFSGKRRLSDEEIKDLREWLNELDN